MNAPSPRRFGRYRGCTTLFTQAPLCWGGDQGARPHLKSATFLMALGFIVGVALPSAVLGQNTSGFRPFQNMNNPLRSLPPMRALPINQGAGVAQIAPDAIETPDYCDSAQLRSVASFHAIRFWDNQNGVAVGDHGAIVFTADGGRHWAVADSGVECRLNDAIWINSRQAIVIGGGFDSITRLSRGVVLLSSDAGQTWRRSSDSELPFLRSLKVHADDSRARRHPVVIAQGHPDPITGATQFESQDGGRSWQTVMSFSNNGETEPAQLSTKVDSHQAKQWSDVTDSTTVHRTFVRLGERTLLCAGDHGTIRRSEDGGHSWNIVNGQDGGCGLMVIAKNARKIPWALLGRESLEKRIRTNLVVGPTTRRRDDLIHHAAMNLGVSGVDWLPGDSQLAESQATIEEVKRWVDIHRPPVIALDSSFDDELKSAVLQYAVGLGTQKVVEFSRGQRAEMLFHDSAVLLHSGVLAGDFQHDSELLVNHFDLLASMPQSNPWTGIHFRFGDDIRASSGDSLGSAVRFAQRHQLPERVFPANQRRSQIIRGRLKQESAITQFFHVESSQSLRDEEEFSAALKALLDQTSRQDQFRSAWKVMQEALGRGYESIVWQEIGDRFAGSSAAELALLHREARINSHEWALLESLTSIGDSSPSSFAHVSASANDSTAPLPISSQDLVPGANGHAAIVSPFQSHLSPDLNPVVQASATVPISHRRGNVASPRSSSRELDLSWQMHPIRLITLDAIERGKIRRTIENAAPMVDEATLSDESDSSEGMPEVSVNDDGPSADVRRIAERQSVWGRLLKPDSPQMTVALNATVRPKLDGILQEPFWNNPRSRPAITQNDDGLKLQCAWDDEFVYLAITAPRQTLQTPLPGQEAGHRDANLTAADRIAVAIDTDQDLLTAMRLAYTVDSRTQDDIDGHPEWNPTWYLASNQTADRVTTEIAIERSSLCRTLGAGDSWFIEFEAIPAGQSRFIRLMPEAQRRVRVDFQ